MPTEPETIWGMWESLNNALPDISGVLLAAVGVALAFLPDKVMKLPPFARWIIGVVLVLLGGFGLRSSFIQRQQDSTEKAQLKDSIRTLQAKVDSYGPMLKEIINHPQSPEQKELALVIQRELNQKKTEIHDCKPDPSRPYECINNTVLGRSLVDYADKIFNLADQRVRNLHEINQTSENPGFNRGSHVRTEWMRFTDDMKCCVEEITARRQEAMGRLGAKGKDLDEMRAWDNMTYPLKDSQNVFKWLDPRLVHDYAPYLEKMGQKLMALPEDQRNDPH